MGEQNHSSKLRQALEHETQFIARVLNEENESLAAETMRYIQQSAAAGRLDSPATKTILLNIERQSLERIVRKVIDNRFALADDVPEIASDSLIDKLRKEVSEMVEIRFQGMIPRIAKSTGHIWPDWKTGDPNDKSLEDDKLRLSAWANQELDFETSKFRLRASKTSIEEPTGQPVKESDTSLKQGVIIAVVGGVFVVLAAFITSWDKWFPEKTPDLLPIPIESLGRGQPSGKRVEQDLDQAAASEHQDSNDDASAPSEIPDGEGIEEIATAIADKAAVFSPITMDEFFSKQYSGTELQTDEFEREMIGKTVIWTGAIRSIRTGENNDVKVVVQPINAYGSAHLEFDSLQRNEFLKLNAGQIIRFTGKIRSIVASPFIGPCTLLRVVE